MGHCFSRVLLSIGIPFANTETIAIMTNIISNITNAAAITTTTTVPDRETVYFNVGGKLYEVSRSLLEEHPDTMLARFASDTWCGTDGDKGRTKDRALFIERSGDRFEYCLDYMRNAGKVALPPFVSKEALVEDLSYYGFEGVDPSTISREATLPMLKMSFDYIDKLIQDLDNQLDMKQRYLDLAKHCLRQYKKDASLSFDIYKSSHGLHRPAKGLTGNDSNYENNRQIFNEILNPIGLTFHSAHKEYCPYTIKLAHL